MRQDQAWPAQQGRVSCSPGLGSAFWHVLLCPQPCCCKGPKGWAMIPRLLGCWCQAPSGWKEDTFLKPWPAFFVVQRHPLFQPVHLADSLSSSTPVSLVSAWTHRGLLMATGETWPVFKQFLQLLPSIG